MDPLDDIDRLLERLRQVPAPARYETVIALASQRDPRIPPALLPLLTDPDPLLRANAASGLGLNHFVEAVTALLPLLNDFAEVEGDSAHAFVAQYAAEALLQIGTEDALAAVEQWRPAAREQLMPHRVREMTHALIHSDAQRREEAVQALVREGHAVIPQMIAALDHPQARVRQGAARVLGELGAAEAADRLLLALADDDVGVWSQAAAALAKLPLAAPALKEALANTQRLRVKQGAAVALWRQERYEPAFHWLLISMHDQEVVVQGSAVTSLWQQPDERALATLQTLLTPQDTTINRYIVQALQSIGTPRALGTIQRWLHEVFPTSD
jgi:HEAT repeat protein